MNSSNLGNHDVNQKPKKFWVFCLFLALACGCSPDYQPPTDAAGDVVDSPDVEPNDSGRDVDADVSPVDDTRDSSIEVGVDFPADAAADANDSGQDAAGDTEDDDTCPLNACGGCGELLGEPGARCGTCGWGIYTCHGAQVLCDGDQGERARNACGGCAVLDGLPGATCGPCGNGEYECQGEDQILCIGDGNACDGCVALDERAPGMPCGPCSNGVYECTDPNRTACVVEELCAEGARCSEDADCETGHCGNGRCTPPGYVYAPPGVFLAGPRPGIDELSQGVPQHEVTLTRGFLVQTTEATQSQWLEYMGLNPSNHQCLNCPVENVGFHEALLWLNLRSEADGLEPCYRLRGCRGDIGSDFRCSSDNWGVRACQGWRLPTQAEWEYMARAGTVTRTYAGDLELHCEFPQPETDRIAWTCRNSGGHPHEGGQLRPNPWGIFDAIGNVSEITYDWWHPIGPEPLTNPVDWMPADYRVELGSSCIEDAFWVYTRDYVYPDGRWPYRGFRPVRTVFYE